MLNLIVATLFALLLFSLTSFAQPPRTPLDDYLDTAETIIVAKCITAGPLNILLQSDVSVEVVHVVKGDAELRSLSLRLNGGLQPGKIYLIRIPKTGEKKPFASEGPNVVPVSPHEDMAKLKTLPAQIVVLRTMNIRIADLEAFVRRSTSEMEGLKAIRKRN